MSDRSLQAAKNRALLAGLPKPQVETMRVSEAKGKRFAIRSPSGKLINFGAWPVKTGTFIDHGRIPLKTAWWKRHEAIKNTHGENVIDNPRAARIIPHGLCGENPAG